MELTQEEIKTLCEFTGNYEPEEQTVFNKIDGYISIDRVCAGWERYNSEILLESMSKLTGNGWIFKFYSKYLCVIDPNDIHGLTEFFNYSDHNNDKLLTLSHAILYAIKESK